MYFFFKIRMPCVLLHQRYLV